MPSPVSTGMGDRLRLSWRGVVMLSDAVFKQHAAENNCLGRFKFLCCQLSSIDVFDLIGLSITQKLNLRNNYEVHFCY